MIAAVVFAGIEATIVLAWIGSFIKGGAIGTPHQLWYVEFPLLFLLVPVATMVFAAARPPLRRPLDGRGCLSLTLLAINQAALVAYAMSSGGGV